MSVVVADASPLIFLSRLGLLDLLPQIFDSVLVPRAVFEEAVHGGDSLAGAAGVAEAEWLVVRDTEPDASLVRALTRDLGAGETAAILLALDVAADLVLIDDRSARAAARRLRLTVRGTLGVLLEAKRQGLIEELGTHVDRLKSAGAWLSDDLVQKVLKAAHESTSD